MVKTDEDLRRDVLDELKWESRIKNPAAIAVAVKDGVVTLSGYLDSYMEKMAAEDAAKRVSGVKAVVQNIEVKLPSSSERTDVDIAQSVRDALDFNTLVPADKIKVKVEKGWVTLEGEVEWLYQKEEAYDTASRIKGVKGVINLIELKPHVTPADIKERIEQALKRMATVDASKIKVEMRDGKAVLKGEVRSWAEKQEAERAAFSAPGVNSVENNILIMP
jgi:osmotically-inducible protein OsmY